MVKVKRSYLCSRCGVSHSRWQGQCTSCSAWNTVSEVSGNDLYQHARARKNNSLTGYAGEVTPSRAQVLSEIDLQDVPRFGSGFEELDRVLGGGIVPGSTILVGGNPGTGKSTLLLQVMCSLATRMLVLYVTGEESLKQVAMRASRLNLTKDELKVFSGTNIDQICDIAKQVKPRVLVVDSIQVMHVSDIHSLPSSVAQVRESATALTRYAKQNNVAVFIVGHVTKEGVIAGPKVLEHIIDCSLLLEGGTDSDFRTLRSQKNRFGSINELGVFAMKEQGMQEITNPSTIFLSQGGKGNSGSAVMAVWEGSRALLVEVQVLVDSSQLTYPRRVAVGLGNNRLSLLLAILSKHGGLKVADQDVFVNVVGGVKISETASDLALVMALLSSFFEKILPNDVVIFGEVGLSGEIRPVPGSQERLREAFKHGFKRAVIPYFPPSSDHIFKSSFGNIRTYPLKNLSEVISTFNEL